MRLPQSICLKRNCLSPYSCGYCRAATGDSFLPGLTEDQIDECEEIGFSVAPIPASYISEIRQRNKTVTLPKLSSTSSSVSSSRSGTLFPTPLVDPAKGTVTGMPTINLPTLIPPTAPVESMGKKARTMEPQAFKYLAGAAFMACVTFVV